MDRKSADTSIWGFKGISKAGLTGMCPQAVLTPLHAPLTPWRWNIIVGVLPPGQGRPTPPDGFLEERAPLP